MNIHTVTLAKLSALEVLVFQGKIKYFNICAFSSSGNPLFLEPFWMRYKASSAVMVPALHRMAYTMEGGGSNSVTDRLKQLILRLHTIVGNANVTGRFIVIGVGSSQLINAAVRALSAPNGSRPSSPSALVATPPYYPVSSYFTQSFILILSSHTWSISLSALFAFSTELSIFFIFIILKTPFLQNYSQIKSI